MTSRHLLAAFAVSIACLGAVQAVAEEALTEEERGWLAKASREEVNGWIWLKTGGQAFERGFQHGYLVAAEFKDAWRVYDAMTLQTIGLDLDFFVEKAAAMHKPLIPKEQLDEMSGIAAGLTKAGVPTTLDQIIGWNAYMEMTGYWWPTVATQYKAPRPAPIRARARRRAIAAPSSPRARPRPTAGSSSATKASPSSGTAST